MFDHAGGQKPAIANPEAFKVAQKDYTQAVMNHPQFVTYRDYGTQAMPQMTQSFAALPTHNFSRGTFYDVEKISGRNHARVHFELRQTIRPIPRLHGGMHDQVLERLWRGRWQDHRLAVGI